MEINYKLHTEKEEHKIYNQKVIKLKTTYKLKLNLPYWIDCFYLFNFFPHKPISDADVCNLGYPVITGEGLKRRRNYEITFTVNTMSKCKDDDKFNEIKGLHICETKAEIKALKIVSKFISRIKRELCFDDSDINTSLNNRLDKNCKNLNRLCE